MPKNLIDFPCSPTWQNWYHSKGMTPHYVVAHDEAEIARLQEEVAHLRRQRKELKISDEEWFEQKFHDRTLQNIMARKDQYIEELQQEVTTLRQQLHTTTQPQKPDNEILGLS